MASSQADQSIGRATLNQQLNPQWPMLTGRMRLSATRLVPPGGEQSERSLPAAYGGDYFQRLRDASLQDHIVNASNTLLHRVRSSAVRAHFGRCGSGWSNVTAYRDYSGRNYLFVDGQARERDDLFRHVKRRYVRSYTQQPESMDVAPEVRHRTLSHAATARPNLDLQWTRAHALSHNHEHRPYEVEQAYGGASSIDVTRILSSALRSDAQRGGSRYSWHREDLL